MKKTLALLLAAFMVFAFAAGCNKTEKPAPTPGTEGDTDVTDTANVGPDGRVRSEKQEYRTLYSTEVASMNYLSVYASFELTTGANTIDSLVENDSTGNVLPSGALSWECSADGLTWTFKLRPDQYWYDCDGNQMDPVTAHDYVAAIRYVCAAQNDCTNSYLVVGWVTNTQEYYDYTSAVMAGFKNEKGEYLDRDPATATAEVPAKVVPEVKPEDIGVVAVDDLTLEYHMVTPRPYFVSALQYGTYWPAPARLLEELGTQFGIDNTQMWFNGSYIMKEFEPQGKHVYQKNEHNWDAENVHIEKITETYNAEAAALAPELFLRGDIDYATLDSELLADWKNDPAKVEQVAPTRIGGGFSYFMCFQFAPRFDAEYEPDNWGKAVNSENFRKSIFHGLDRLKAIAVEFPENPEQLVQNCITPQGAVNLNGVDYTNIGDLAAISSRDSFDEALALEYKAKALEDFKAMGVTLPVKIPMTYNSGTDIWGQQCVVMDQQLEALLGTDYIDISVVPGTSQGFLGAVRRGGKYAFMKCNWGADFADPQTWTEPFLIGSSWNAAWPSMEKYGMDTKTPETVAICAEYHKRVAEADAELFDMDKRYELYANAEAYYINHAMVVPFTIAGGTNTATRLNPFEGQFGLFGSSSSRFKGQWVYDTAMSTEMFNAQLPGWRAAMGLK